MQQHIMLSALCYRPSVWLFVRPSHSWSVKNSWTLDNANYFDHTV